MIKKIKNVLIDLRDLFKRSFAKNEESQFRFSVGIKMTLIPILTGTMAFSFVYIFLRINLLFFEANGFMQIKELREAFFEVSFGGVHNFVVYIAVFLVLNFFIGMYIADMLLRPFKLIGDYCEKCVEQSRAVYNPGFFSDLRVLTSFSEYFFNICESAKLNKSFPTMIIPDRFKSIHRPVFERSFFFHYFIFIIMTAVATMYMMFIVINNIYESMIELAVKQLEGNQSVQVFFNGESEIFNFIIISVMALYLLLSIILTSHLYNKVAAPAFAIFSTMRSFAKGNSFSRVHLIGSYFLRPHCRKINKFLEYMESEFVKK